MTEPNVYRRAADVMRAGGLAKEVLEDEDGGHCTIGAVRVAKYGTVTQGYASDEEVIFLSDLLGGPTDADAKRRLLHFMVVTDWSDAAERTPEDVIGLLEQAAEKLEADQ